MAPLYIDNEKRRNPHNTALLLISENVAASSASLALKNWIAAAIARVKRAYPANDEVTWISNHTVFRAGYMGVIASLARMAQNSRMTPIGVVIRDVFAILYLKTTTRFVRIMAQLKNMRVSYLLAIGACPTAMVRMTSAVVCKSNPAAVITL